MSVRPAMQFALCLAALSAGCTSISERSQAIETQLEDVQVEGSEAKTNLESARDEIIGLKDKSNNQLKAYAEAVTIGIARYNAAAGDVNGLIDEIAKAAARGKEYKKLPEADQPPFEESLSDLQSAIEDVRAKRQAWAKAHAGGGDDWWKVVAFLLTALISAIADEISEASEEQAQNYRDFGERIKLLKWDLLKKPDFDQ